jgi:transposase
MRDLILQLSKVRFIQQSPLDAEDVVPATPRSQPVAAAAPESLNISCEVTFRHGSLRLNGAISENILNLLIRELKR